LKESDKMHLLTMHKRIAEPGRFYDITKIKKLIICRRRGDLPDPEWDCLERNVRDLIHFICEQEVSLSFTKYCQPLRHQLDSIIEGFLYHDSTTLICKNVHMCPFQ